MDSIIKFKEAAKALQDDERCVALRAARKANDEDTELQEQLGEFRLVQLDLNNEMSKDDRHEERVAELNNRMTQLYSEVMGNPNMIAYNNAKSDIEAFMDHVNAILNTAIDGGDPMGVDAPQAHGCGGGCSSCSGC